jgi:hypothetical protein
VVERAPSQAGKGGRQAVLHSTFLLLDTIPGDDLHTVVSGTSILNIVQCRVYAAIYSDSKHGFFKGEERREKLSPIPTQSMLPPGCLLQMGLATVFPSWFF